MKFVKYIILNIALLGLLVSVWHWYAEKYIPFIPNTEEDIIQEIVFCPPPPEIVICEEAPRPSFPEHWGPPPNIQLRDYVKLPEPYGQGSSTLKYWIEENQKKDANPVSFRPSGERIPTLEESFNKPDTVPNIVLPRENRNKKVTEVR